MEERFTDQIEPPSPVGAPSGSSRRGPFGQQLVRHPLVLVIVALVVGAAVGLVSQLGGHPAKAPASGAVPSSQGSAAQAGTLSTPEPSPGMHLTFDQTFAGSTLNTQVWNTCFYYAPKGTGCSDFANKEVQWYLPSQDQVSGGVLHLVASPVAALGTNADSQPEIYPCRSGMVTTDPYFDFTYGYVQIVARIPKGQNTWPTLWMLPANHATDVPSISLMEVIGTATDRPSMIFDPVAGQPITRSATTADLSSGWHTFGLSWEPGALTWFIDGNAVFTVTTQVPDQPMYLLANLAITDQYSTLRLPSSCTGSLSIRSVQVWQDKPA
jgi:beta-glucanase (GH16 family)